MADGSSGVPTPMGGSRVLIERLAEDVTRQVGYRVGAPLDSLLDRVGGRTKLACSCGCTCCAGERDWFEGSASTGFSVTLPRDTGLLRDCFDTVQALGHWVLHCLYPVQQGGADRLVRVPRWSTDQAFLEAFWFAAAFLMPAEAFRQGYTECRGNAFLLSGRFGVSPQAVHRRALALGLKSEGCGGCAV